MSRALDIAATGMQAQQLFVDVISQNLANINTTAFKRERPEFEDLIYQNLTRVGTNAADDGSIVPVGVSIGLGVKTAAIYRTHQQGPVQQTENPLDIAIQGEGYLQVALPSGETAYTRSGNLQLSDTGELVTNDGYSLEPSITVPVDAESITINASGEVFAEIQGQIAPSNLGQLQLATFLNQAGLEALGNNLYLETPASGTATAGTPGQDGAGSILQGFLETSNVNPVTELTNLIRAQRAYEMNSKVISKQDEMLQNLNQSA